MILRRPTTGPFCTPPQSPEDFFIGGVKCQVTKGTILNLSQRSVKGRKDGRKEGREGTGPPVTVPLDSCGTSLCAP